LAPVTILKPLCGLEPGLYKHLRSFCIQNHPQYQVVFGVSDLNDPALAVVDRLLHEFPHLAIDVVVDERQYGSNCKNSNLMNMLRVARHGILVIADSDVEVGPDYLEIVTAPLLESTVGLVTCIYRCVPTNTVWSRLGAMYINEWFMPSVQLAWLFGHESYASGQTLCFSRTTLDAIGGLENIANHLADDYRLGELIRGKGLRIVLSTYEIEVEHHETTWKSMVEHQFRWMRTLRLLRPGSFRFIFLTFSQPLALLGITLVSLAGLNGIHAVGLFVFTFIAQLALHLRHRLRRGPILTDLLLVPARDVLLCWIWCRSFFTSGITWRGTKFNVEAHGLMRRVE
jgi:ceramide glucosyltransferase